MSNDSTDQSIVNGPENFPWKHPASYEDLQVMFPKSSYLMSQLALAHYNHKEYEEALQLFEQMRSIDPHKLESLDTY